MMAAESGQHENAKILLSAGADVCAWSQTGETACHRAAAFGHEEALQVWRLARFEVVAIRNVDCFAAQCNKPGMEHGQLYRPDILIGIRCAQTLVFCQTRPGVASISARVLVL